MTRHLLRLIWNRKRQNFLLTVEIFFAFLTLFGVVLFAVHYANNARQPLGFDIDRVWSVTVDRKEPDEDPAVKARHRETYRQLVVALREMPEVEGVAGSFTGPIRKLELGQRHAAGRRAPGPLRRQQRDRRFSGALSHTARGRTLVLARGRRRDVEAGGRESPAWLGRSSATAIRSGRSSRRSAIPTKRLPDPDDKPEVKRVIGVIDEFRQNGELATAENYMFQRMRLDDADAEGGCCPSACSCAWRPARLPPSRRRW